MVLGASLLGATSSGSACFSGRSSSTTRGGRRVACAAEGPSWNGQEFQTPRGYKYYTVDVDLGAPKQETYFPAPRGYKYYEMQPVQPSVSEQFLHIPYPHVQFTGVDANLSSPVLLLAVALSGIYTAGAATLGLNFDLTSFQKDKKWQMIGFWPFLFSSSTSFREQFAKALIGAPPEQGTPQLKEDLKL